MKQIKAHLLIVNVLLEQYEKEVQKLKEKHAKMVSELKKQAVKNERKT